MKKPGKGKVSFSSIARRLTGISTPFFGISWDPPEDERELVRSLIIFLEDRRALYYPDYCEHFPWVTESILEIRKELTNTLQSAPENSNMVGPLQAMRAACRKYMDESGARPGRTYDYMREINLTMALGELRAAIGIQLARLCAAYGIDISEELSRILPAEPE